MKKENLIAAFVVAAGVAIAAGTHLLLLNPNPAIGDRMEDATISAGKSPDAHRKMYTTPADAPGTYSFDQAKAYCAGLDAHSHNDWRVPSKRELNVLFNSRAAIGGFDH